MDYILIPTKDKAETDFFMDLLKKMHKEAKALSPSDMADMAFKESSKGVAAEIKKKKNDAHKNKSGKKNNASKPAFDFSWEGGLKDLKNDFDGVKLQHHINSLRK